MVRQGLVTSLFFAMSAFAAPVRPYIINGTPVPDGQYTEVVQIKSETGDNCAATVVGPRTLITAAHCAKNSATVSFSIAGTAYKATVTKSSLYPSKNHDLALAVTTNDITGINPATIGSAQPPVSNSVNILGFGCTAVDQPSDNKLRIGQTVVQGLDQYQFHSGTASGALLCYGDSGGPVFLDQAGGGRQLIGVSAMGNITTTNYHVRLDIPESQTLLTQFASANNTKICGVAGYTCGGTPPPPPQDPSCTLVANPTQVSPNGKVVLSLTTSNATSATIGGATASVPNDQKTVTAAGPGTYTVPATASNATKTANCSATYLVSSTPPPPPPPDQAPACTITATPSEAWQGDLISLDLQSTGKVDYASIDGTKVQFPLGRKIVSAREIGDHSVLGFVRDSVGGGSANCRAYYTVHSGVHPPPIPKFAVVPAYCGDNNAGGTIKTVCWSVIHTDAATKLRTPYALLVKFNDSSPDETLLVAAHTAVTPKPGDTVARETLALYANKTIPTADTVVFDTRNATLTKQISTTRADSVVPLAVEGTTMNKLKFAVPTLTAVTTTSTR